MKTPLTDAVLNYINSNPLRFHTPGHAGTLPEIGGAAALDVTELPGLDSLYEADGVIAESERAAALVYGSKKTLYSAGGNTLCIQTMLALAAARHPGGKVILPRASVHRSAVNAMALLSLEPVFTVGELSAEVLRPLIKSDTAAVYLTSPDYFGRMADIGGISVICREYGVPLLVDNAHGSHFRFLRDTAGVPLHPLVHGADLVADSAHKTLPVMTGGALLHIGNGSFSEEFSAGAKSRMALFGSTSPSYLIMLSLEQALCRMSRCGEAKFSALAERVSALRAAAAAKGLLPDFVKTDPVRLTFYSAISPYLAAENVTPELDDGDYTVLLPSLNHTDTDFDRISAAIDKAPSFISAPATSDAPELPGRAMTLREAVLSKSEIIPLSEAIGRIAAEITGKCPPGVPVTVPGEIISEPAVKKLISYGIYEISVVI